jgi:hypothetical protein
VPAREVEVTDEVVVVVVVVVVVELPKWRLKV